MIPGKFPIVCFTVFLLLSSCAAPLKGLYPPDPQAADNKRIYVVNHGRHTDILLDRKEASQYLSALEGVFPDAAYIEVGWGDGGYLLAERKTIDIIVRAIFWPTDSVLAVRAFLKHPEQYILEKKVVSIEISNDGFKHMVEFINNSFYIDNESKVVELGEHLHKRHQIYFVNESNELVLLKSSSIKERFYLAKEKYHLFNSCNIWTAKALRAAGLPIHTFHAFTVDSLFSQLKRIKCDQEGQ